MKKMFPLIPFLSLLLLGFPALAPLAAQEEVQLSFKEHPGRVYRRITRVEEAVYYEGRLSHEAEIINRALMACREVSPEGFLMEARFQTSEQSRRDRRIFHWAGEELVRFRRRPQGEMTVLSDSALPVLRGFPSFPEEPVQQGDVWVGEAREVHDFREAFGPGALLVFPVKVTYRLVGRQGALWRIEADYQVYHSFEALPGELPGPFSLVSGASRRELLWDNEAGRLDSSRESFDFRFFLTGGKEIRYTGRAETEVEESDALNRRAEKQRLEEDLDLSVEEREDGLALVLPDIFFNPDSSEIREDQRPALEEVARVLRRYPNREIRVEGHAARVGPEAYLQSLSEERAQEVVEFLLDAGAGDPGRIWARGMGSRQPAVPNDTPGNRRLNRRVEIILLDEK